MFEGHNALLPLITEFDNEPFKAEKKASSARHARY